MKNLNALVLILLTIPLLACSSLTKKAQDHFEKGEFDAAASLYERALGKNPHDADAIEGLKRTRQQLVQDRLIQVRQQRLANNTQNALDLLNGIYVDEARWSMAPQGPAFATQNEESLEAFQWWRKEERAEIAAGQELKSKLSAEKYRLVFESSELAQMFARAQAEINISGLSHCHSLKKSSEGPFASGFVRRYCMLWGAKDQDGKSSPPPGVPTYGSINVEGKIESLPVEVISTLTDSLLMGLKATPYYSPDAPPLTVQLHGDFVSTYFEAPYTEVFTYSVQVPYQVQVTVPYQVSVTKPYQSSELVPVTRQEWNPVTRSMESKTSMELQTITRYHEESETRYRDDWETQYRSEERSLPYPATRYNLSFRLNAKASFNIEKVEYVLPLTDELNQSDTFHQTNDPQIGLYAKPKVAPTSIAWLTTSFQRAGQSTSDRIAATWDAKYCRTPSNLIERTQTETIMKCLHGTRTSHEFVENWFQARFGLPYATVNQAIGNF